MTQHEEVQLEGVRYLVFAVKTIGGYRGAWICKDSGDRGEYEVDVASPQSAFELANRGIQARHSAMLRSEEPIAQSFPGAEPSSKVAHDPILVEPHHRRYEPVDLVQSESREERHRHAVVMQAVSRWVRADAQLIAEVGREVHSMRNRSRQSLSR
jgi:hypothetical protein